MDKTLAMRVLEGRGIAYTTAEYDVGERDARRVAALLGVPAEQVLKTLVVLAPRGKPLLVIVPADRRLDLRRLAASLGEKKLKMAAHREAEALTGLEVGGISPLALLNKGFRFLVDEAARGRDWVFVSAGRKGTNLRLPLDGLMRVTGARWVDGSVAAGDDDPAEDSAG